MKIYTPEEYEARQKEIQALLNSPEFQKLSEQVDIQSVDGVQPSFQDEPNQVVMEGIPASQDFLSDYQSLQGLQGASQEENQALLNSPEFQKLAGQVDIESVDGGQLMQYNQEPSKEYKDLLKNIRDKIYNDTVDVYGVGEDLGLIENRVFSTRGRSDKSTLSNQQLTTMGSSYGAYNVAGGIRPEAKNVIDEAKEVLGNDFEPYINSLTQTILTVLESNPKHLAQGIANFSNLDQKFVEADGYIIGFDKYGMDILNNPYEDEAQRIAFNIATTIPVAKAPAFLASITGKKILKNMASQFAMQVAGEVALEGSKEYASSALGNREYDYQDLMNAGISGVIGELAPAAAIGLGKLINYGLDVTKRLVSKKQFLKYAVGNQEIFEAAKKIRDIKNEMKIIGAKEFQNILSMDPIKARDEISAISSAPEASRILYDQMRKTYPELTKSLNDTFVAIGSNKQYKDVIAVLKDKAPEVIKKKQVRMSMRYGDALDKLDPVLKRKPFDAGEFIHNIESYANDIADAGLAGTDIVNSFKKLPFKKEMVTEEVFDVPRSVNVERIKGTPKTYTDFEQASGQRSVSGSRSELSQKTTDAFGFELPGNDVVTGKTIVGPKQTHVEREIPGSGDVVVSGNLPEGYFRDSASGKVYRTYMKQITEIRNGKDLKKFSQFISDRLFNLQELAKTKQIDKEKIDKLKSIYLKFMGDIERHTKGTLAENVIKDANAIYKRDVIDRDFYENSFLGDILNDDVAGSKTVGAIFDKSLMSDPARSIEKNMLRDMIRTLDKDSREILARKYWLSKKYVQNATPTVAEETGTTRYLLDNFFNPETKESMDLILGGNRVFRTNYKTLESYIRRNDQLAESARKLGTKVYGEDTSGVDRAVKTGLIASAFGRIEYAFNPLGRIMSSSKQKWMAEMTAKSIVDPNYAPILHRIIRTRPKDITAKAYHDHFMKIMADMYRIGKRVNDKSLPPEPED